MFDIVDVLIIVVSNIGSIFLLAYIFKRQINTVLPSIAQGVASFSKLSKAGTEGAMMRVEKNEELKMAEEAIQLKYPEYAGFIAMIPKTWKRKLLQTYIDNPAIFETILKQAKGILGKATEGGTDKGLWSA